MIHGRVSLPVITGGRQANRNGPYRVTGVGFPDAVRVEAISLFPEQPERCQTGRRRCHRDEAAIQAQRRGTWGKLCPLGQGCYMHPFATKIDKGTTNRCPRCSFAKYKCMPMPSRARWHRRGSFRETWRPGGLSGPLHLNPVCICSSHCDTGAQTAYLASPSAA